MPRMYRGSNLDLPDVTTAEELADFFAYTDQPSGRPLPSYAMWAELRPAILKRCLSWMTMIRQGKSWSSPPPYLNFYAAHG